MAGMTAIMIRFQMTNEHNDKRCTRAKFSYKTLLSHFCSSSYGVYKASLTWLVKFNADQM